MVIVVVVGNIEHNTKQKQKKEQGGSGRKTRRKQVIVYTYLYCRDPERKKKEKFIIMYKFVNRITIVIAIASRKNPREKVRKG